MTVVVDEAAASQLAHADYYRYAFANKPAWQGLWRARSAAWSVARFCGSQCRRPRAGRGGAGAWAALLRRSA
ncbi:MAG: hypothetical protein R2692_00390 [Microbacterium sp.]